MKLSNEQINAIVNTIRKKDDERFKKEEQIVKKRKDVLKEANKYVKILDKIPSNIRRLSYLDKDFSTILNAVIKAKGLTVKRNFNESDFRNKIIIASIDVNTIEELKGKLNIKL